jgi:ATP-dependent DNA helicase RecG
VFFGQHYLVRTIRAGQQLVLSGATSVFGNRVQMISPEWEELDTENLHTIGIVPVYPLTKGLKGRGLRRQMKTVVDTWAARIVDYVPESTLERAELGELGWALKNLHFPEGMDHLHHAKRRFIFDELLLLQLAILGNRHDWQSVPGQALEVTDDFLEPFITTVFPYELTGAQQRAIADIRQDVALSLPMNRLLQGDVGSGKTAVATVAVGMALANGKQAAIMAPTSILAEQHYRNIGVMLEKMPGGQKPVVALLTSALTTSERQSIYRGLTDGSIDVVIGTHALIQEGVEFKDLAVAVIDEQHRFGVEQRGALRGKGSNPHLLVMTATPIPRTLALTLYADLDLTIIDEKPPGRQPVGTRIIQPIARERIYNFVEAQLEQGRQAFIVHPLVEASDTIEAASATEAFERLSEVFFRYRVCLLHGRMKPAEKEAIMAAFAEGDYDVMVTTSVAEVGVDVANASVMVIEGANRFGLAQLHQFRGRVGRGEHKSFCLLIPDNDTPEAMQRLAAMEETTDGFKLAEIDWKLRGAGDLIGTRQSGGNTLQLAAEITPDLVELAQREARTIYAEDPTLSLLQHRLLAERVQMLYNADSDVS